jgi:RNA polymerase sigma-70 factor, ECF subfamily
MDELRQRLARGEQSAFAELYDLYAGRLFRYLTVQLDHLDDATDVMQEVFVRLARGRNGFSRGNGDLTGYVFTVARNEAVRWYRRNRRLRDAVNVAQMSRQEDKSVEIADSARFALASLNETQREVVVLKIYGGLTLSEIAQTIGVPQGTVATRYRAALVRMRERLARNES